MDIRTALLQEHSKAQALRIADYIGTDDEKFDTLMQLFLHDEWLINQRAAGLLTYYVDKHPHLISKYLPVMVENLRRPVHDAVIRNTVRVFETIDLPEMLLGDIADICFELLSQQQPVAIKAHAMTVLANIAQREPELAPELILLIEDQLPYAKAAYIARAKKVLKQLKSYL